MTDGWPIARDDSHVELLGPADDDFHPPDDSRWFHETCWFWFSVPEQRLGGWLYNWVRPNVGTSGGGCWVWDDSTWSHLEVPYYACYNNLALADDRDLRDFTFASGVAVKVLAPLQRYQLRFADRDLIALELEFDAVMPPWVGSEAGTHFDQVGRVTGTMVLHGETVDVDCLAIRDRTWAPRPERWKDGQIGYCNAASPSGGGAAFLASSAGDVVHGGYFLRDGRRAAIVSGTRDIERDPADAFLRCVTVAAEDSDGRRFTAVGEAISRMAMPLPGVHGVVWSSVVRWTIDGVEAWGEDQDAWPLHGWSAFRRSLGRSG